MAQYHVKAEKLKPKVAQADFTLDQLNLVHSMMRQCAVLRQGNVISSFFACMLPEEFELREGPKIEGKYGPYRPVYVARKDSPQDNYAQENDAAEYQDV